LYRKLDDFLTAHAQLTAGTGKLLATLTDASLAQAVTPDHRTLGQLAWHLVVTVPEMLGRTGLPLSTVDPQAPPPERADVIATAYGTVHDELAAAVRERWTDADLDVVDEMYGEAWPRRFTLTALVHHEIHHRGQMTVLMRQAGLGVPGLYGPSKEEWAQFGMAAPPY
jgi:uncharacterized damage-inducible protein DinB